MKGFVRRLIRWFKRLVKVRQRVPAIMTTLPLSELPPDLLDIVLTFLTGFELLSLSHASRQFYHGVLASDANAWQRLAPPRSPLISLQLHALSAPHYPSALRICLDDSKPSWDAKQRYLKRRAIRFHGILGRVPSCTRGGAIPTPSLEDIASAGSFSFDLVFALMPALGTVAIAGGILLGAQSVHARVDRHADYHHQLVHTDPNGNLYCSVMRQTPVVVASLAFERWYHVALVFDVVGTRRASQRVYLDGELMHSADGCLHDEWKYFTSAQIGTGCITGGVLGPGVCGWYAFNGLVDECRFWRRALTGDEVRSLGNCGSDDSAPASATCSWSVRDVPRISAVVSCAPHVQSNAWCTM